MPLLSKSQLLANKYLLENLQDIDWLSKEVISKKTKKDVVDFILLFAQVKVVLSSHSSFYTGQKAHLVKRGEGSFTLKPGEKETLSMEVSPESYMDKVVLIIEETLT